MNTSHAKAIKGMSIANIVLASLGIIGILIAWAMLGVGGAAINDSGYDYFYTDEGYIIEMSDINMILGLLGGFIFWGFACLVLVLIAGIMGVRGANKPEKLKSVMVWNIVGAVATETLVSDPAPVTPATEVATEAVTAEVAAAEPAVVVPDNYIEDAQASVTIVEETPANDKPQA